MARPLRLQYPGAVYHLMSRGNGGGNIFNDSREYELFLELFKEVIDEYNWLCYAYCLMPNHYHLLVKTIDPNLSLGMRHLNGRYTQKFNIKNKRFGHVFQGRYKSIVVDMDSYRYELIRYIVLNPVKARFVDNPGKWKWSSHREMLRGCITEDSCLDIESAMKLFADNNQESISAYSDYINLKTDEEDIEKNVIGGIVLGTQEFMQKIKTFISEYKDVKEIPRKERFVYRPELKELFNSEDLEVEKRNKIILQAYIEYGYSFSEISRVIGLHNSSIGKIVKRMKSKTS